MQRPILLLLFGTSLLAACVAGGTPSDPPPSDGPVVGDWVLTGGTIDGAAAPVLEDQRITLTIIGSQVSGVAACNHYGGEIVSGGDGLHLDNLLQTEMACEEPAMAAEAAYLAALSRVRQLVREGDVLVARGEAVELRFEELSAPPTSELVDTMWVLNTVFVGDVACRPCLPRG